MLLLFGSNPKVSVAPDYCTGSVLPWLGRAQAGNSSRHSVGRAWTQTSHGWRAKRPTLAATLLTDSDSEEPTVNGPGFVFSLSADRFQLDFSRFHLAAGSTLLWVPELPTTKKNGINRVSMKKQSRSSRLAIPQAAFLCCLPFPALLSHLQDQDSQLGWKEIWSHMSALKG